MTPGRPGIASAFQRAYPVFSVNFLWNRPIKMRLAVEDVRLFFAIVHIFVDARILPPIPWNEPPPSQDQYEDRNRTKRDNELSAMKFEIQALTTPLTKARAECDLPDDDGSKAHDALEDLLDLLNGLVDDRILRNKVST